MTWTYTQVFDATAIGVRNKVRLLAQENVTTRQRVTDEEIDFVVAEEQNAYMAAARVAELVVGRIGPVTSKRVGSLSVSYGAEFYTKLAASLRARGSAYQVPTAGGLSKSERLAAEQDADRVAESFTVGLHDHPDTVDLVPATRDVL